MPDSQVGSRSAAPAVLHFLQRRFGHHPVRRGAPSQRVPEPAEWSWWTSWSTPCTRSLPRQRQASRTSWATPSSCCTSLHLWPEPRCAAAAASCPSARSPFSLQRALGEPKHAAGAAILARRLRQAERRRRQRSAPRPLPSHAPRAPAARPRAPFACVRTAHMPRPPAARPRTGRLRQGQGADDQDRGRRGGGGGQAGPAATAGLAASDRREAARQAPRAPGREARAPRLTHTPALPHVVH